MYGFPYDFVMSSVGLPENRAGSLACADEGFFWLDVWLLCI